MRLSDMRAMRFVLGLIALLLSAVPAAAYGQAAPATPPTPVAAPVPSPPAAAASSPAPTAPAVTPAPAQAQPAQAAPAPSAEAAPASPDGKPSAPPATTPAAPQSTTAPVAAPAQQEPVLPGAPADEQPPRITSTPPSTSPTATRQPASSEAANEPEPADERARALYLRLGVGVGFAFGSDVADEYADRNQRELSFSGLGVALDWMGGAAVLPSLVIGLGATTDTLTSGIVTNDADQERRLEHSLYFAVIGGFADFYLAPPAGFHMQALLGVSHLSRADDLSRNTGNGFGAVLGAGYDFAVAARWNVGVLARVAVSSFSMDAVGNEQPSPTLYEPTLVWTATFRPES